MIFMGFAYEYSFFRFQTLSIIVYDANEVAIAKTPLLKAVADQMQPLYTMMLT